MKLQFLRNGLPLPGNFEHVTISQKDRHEFDLDRTQQEDRDYEQEAHEHSDDEGSSGEGTVGEDSQEIDEED